MAGRNGWSWPTRVLVALLLVGLAVVPAVGLWWVASSAADEAAEGEPTPGGTTTPGPAVGLADPVGATDPGHRHRPADDGVPAGGRHGGRWCRPGPRLPAGHARRHAALRAAQRRAGDPCVEPEARHRRRGPRGPGPGPALRDCRRRAGGLRRRGDGRPDPGRRWRPAPRHAALPRLAGQGRQGGPCAAHLLRGARRRHRGGGRHQHQRVPWWATRAATTPSGGCPPGPTATGRRWKAVRSAPCW